MTTWPARVSARARITGAAFMKFGLAPTTCATVSGMVLSLGAGRPAGGSGGAAACPGSGDSSIAEHALVAGAVETRAGHRPQPESGAGHRPHPEGPSADRPRP